jgi:hypothetical protein
MRPHERQPRRPGERPQVAFPSISRRKLSGRMSFQTSAM